MIPKPKADPLAAATHYNEAERALAGFDPAWAKAALYFRTNCVWHFGHGNDEMRMSGLLAIHQELEGRRKRFEAGNPQELLHAILLCAQENLPLPSWLALAYRKRMTAFLQPSGPTSLDAVFESSTAPKTPARAGQYRRDFGTGVKLWLAVQEIKNEHKGLDPALRAVLGADRSLGLALTRAKELVKQIDAVQSELTGSELLSHFWAKQRKRATQK